MELDVVSVFLTDDPLRQGNPLGVVPQAGELSSEQMQAIATTLGFSESTFVTEIGRSGYDVRIFTPAEELPFAGHPTLGTAWALRRRDLLSEERCEQRSEVGPTPVRFDGPEVWLTRSGRSEPDLEDRHPGTGSRIARALGLEIEQVGLEARELGRSGHLRPAFSDAGLRQLMVPVRDLGALTKARPDAARLSELTDRGAYVFTATGAGCVRARGFFGPVGVPEDAATGSAAAALGLFLAERLGEETLEITQGVEMGRPSRLLVRAGPDRVDVGGRCGLVLSGTLGGSVP